MPSHSPRRWREKSVSFITKYLRTAHEMLSADAVRIFIPFHFIMLNDVQRIHNIYYVGCENDEKMYSRTCCTQWLSSIWPFPFMKAKLCKQSTLITIFTICISKCGLKQRYERSQSKCLQEPFECANICLKIRNFPGPKNSYIYCISFLVNQSGFQNQKHSLHWFTFIQINSMPFFYFTSLTWSIEISPRNHLHASKAFEMVMLTIRMLSS